MNTLIGFLAPIAEWLVQYLLKLGADYWAKQRAEAEAKANQAVQDDARKKLILDKLEHAKTKEEMIAAARDGLKGL